MKSTFALPSFLLVGLIFSAFASTVLAQAQPVDQAVADLDQLSTSLRQVNTGLRHDGEHSSLYRIDPRNTQPGSYTTSNGVVHQPIYYRVAPGLTAQMDRSDYIVRRGRKGKAKNITPRMDGEFYETIPANTVFILDPRSQPALQQSNDENVSLYGSPTLRRINAGQPDQLSQGSELTRRIAAGQPERLRRENAANVDNVEEPLTRRIAAGQPGGEMVPIDQPDARLQPQVQHQQTARPAQYFNPYQVRADPIDARVNGTVSRLVDGRVSNKMKSTKVSDHPAAGAMNYMYIGQ